MPDTLDYVTRIPDAIPPGRRLVHNVLPQTRRQQPRGQDGFRAWLADDADTDSNVVCLCGWAPELPTHYRRRPSDVEPGGVSTTRIADRYRAEGDGGWPIAELEDPDLAD